MNKEWMKLDNAATIYPLVESDYNPTVYRFSATLEQKIKKEILLEALNRVIKRFPYYKVTLKKGLFWYYLEENNEKLDVYEDLHTPCRRIIKEETNGYLFRVLYKENKLSVEFNHILADGTAGLTFLNTLVFQYLKLMGDEVSLNGWMKDPDGEVNEHEYDDSHSMIGSQYLKTHNFKVDNIKGVFHIKDRLLNRNRYVITLGIVDTNQLSETAKKYNCSITIFLTAIYLKSMLEIQQEQIPKMKKRKAVAIQVPVNMRKRLESDSMRNFSLFITPYYKPNQNDSFEGIIDYLKQFFEEKTDLNSLINLMVQNLKTQYSPFVRLLPLRIKTLITPLIYKAVGVDTFSGTISNIGKIQLPESIERRVSRMEFILGPCPNTKGSCAVIGYQDRLVISFGRNIKKARVEEKFFRKLVQLGIKVQIESQGDTI